MVKIKKTLEEKLVSDDGVSRRGALKTLLSGAALAGAALVLPKEADAKLLCQDSYHPYYGRLRTCTAGIDGQIAHTSAMYSQQYQSQWCWAACIEMVFKYHGYRVPQAKIVQDAWGGQVNMPGTPYQIIRALNKQWVDENGKKFQSMATAWGTNAPVAAQELAADKPLIIGTMGHAMVLTTMTYTGNAYQVVVNNACVLDPWPGRGLRYLNGQEWTNINFAARIRTTKLNP
ncbi:MAG: papain-like cysteine protease family protein [Candidatus Woesearchaeota archaeon]